MVNSRPLAYLNSDNDANLFHPSQILSPKSIIFGRTIHQHNLPFQEVAEQADIAEIWAKRSKIVRDFSENFLKFYLPETNQSKAFDEETDNLKVGDLVLCPKQVSEKDKKQNKTLTGSAGTQTYSSKSLWPVGRIQKLIKSGKGINIAAEIRLGDGVYAKKGGKLKLVKPGTLVVRSIRSLRIVKALQNLTKTQTQNENEKLPMTDIHPPNSKQAPIVELKGKVLEENPSLKLRSGKTYQKRVFWSHEVPDTTLTLMNALEHSIYNSVPVDHCCE